MFAALHKHTTGRQYRVEVDPAVHLMTAFYWGNIIFWPAVVLDRGEYLGNGFMVSVHDPKDGHLIAVVRGQDIRLIREERR